MIDVYSPFDGSLISAIKKNTKDEAEKFLSEAYALYNNKKEWLKSYERIEILNKLADLVAKDADEFAILIAKEGGKPLSDAKIEVARAIDGIKLATKDLMYVMKGEEIPMGYTKPSEHTKAFSVYEPLGVVFAISAFNHPLNLIVHQVVPSIAVGCPIIVKPATKTPLTCAKFINLVHKAGLKETWCRYIVCENTVAESIVSDKRISFFSFIGSSKVGWYLKSKLAAGTKCSMEHGGIAPVIIDDKIDDLDRVVASVVKGGYYHAGQVCISVQRVFISNKIIDSFTAKLVSSCKTLRVGDPTLLETEVGPLISHAEVDRIDSWVNDAIKEGAKLLCGGKKISSSLYEPTVLLNPSQTSKVSNEEVFGPVVCVYGYDNLEDAVNIANHPDYEFQTAVFSNNINTIMYAFNNLSASAVIVNEHSAFRVDWMPFAGRKSSGYGIGGISDTMKEMIKHKMLVIKNDALF